MRLKDLLARFTGAAPELDKLRTENKQLRQAMERAKIRIPDSATPSDEQPQIVRTGRIHSWSAWQRQMEMRALERSGEKKIAGFRES